MSLAPLVPLSPIFLTDTLVGCSAVPGGCKVMHRASSVLLGKYHRVGSVPTKRKDWWYSTVMSAPLCLQSAGRGDLKFWGEDNRPTVYFMGKCIGIRAEAVVEKNRQVEGLGGLVQVETRKNRLKAAPIKSPWKRNIFKPQQASKGQSRREDRQERRQIAFNVLESVVETEQHYMRNKRRVCFVLDSPRFPCGRQEHPSFEESSRNIRKKRRMSSAIKRERRRLLEGHRDRNLDPETRFQGQVTAGDSSDWQGKMSRKDNKEKGEKKVSLQSGMRGGTSSPNWPEKVAFLVTFY